MQFKVKQKTWASKSKLATAILLLGMGTAQASTVEIFFNTIASQGNTNGGTPGTLASGTTVDLKITDVSANVLEFAISANLTGRQELNKLYLDLPTAETSGLTGISISNSTVNSAPLAFTHAIVNNPQTGSEWANTLLLIPNSTTAALTGKNDLLIAFAAATISGSVTSVTFDLTFTGATVTAADFLSLTPANNVNGFAQIALQGGTAGSGTGVLSGVGSQQSGGSQPGVGVPEPATIALLGLGLAGISLRKRQA